MHGKIPGIFGLSGISPEENARARLLGRILEWPMILLAFWIILAWYLEAEQEISPAFALATDWVIWGFFAGETLLFLLVVDDRFRYLKGNWANLVIILSGMPLLWDVLPVAGGLRTLRLLVLFSLLINMSSAARKILSRNHIGTTLVVSFIIVVMSGTMMAVIDPNIKTPLDGIWWAWVTITTVGYGDIVPGSTAGRFFGALLILLGIALFSMLTASFSAFFLEQSEEKLEQKEDENLLRIRELESTVKRLEHKIDRLLENKGE